MKVVKSIVALMALLSLQTGFLCGSQSNPTNTLPAYGSGKIAGLPEPHPAMSDPAVHADMYSSIPAHGQQPVPYPDAPPPPVTSPEANQSHSNSPVNPFSNAPASPAHNVSPASSAAPVAPPAQPVPHTEASPVTSPEANQSHPNSPVTPLNNAPASPAHNVSPASSAAPVAPPDQPVPHTEAPPVVPVNNPEVTATTPAPMGSAVQVPQKKSSLSVSSGVNFAKDEQEQAVDDQDVVDTVNIKSSGNWVFKNYWWRKIEELYGEIKDAFNQVMTSRMSFFSQRSEVDKELDRFYQQIGLEQGGLEDIINLALEIMEKEKDDQGFLNKKERAFFNKVKEKQRQLTQLKEDVKAIEELDKKIDEALEVVLQQVDICNKYEQEAWTTFKNVARELSDKEARKNYYDTKGLLDDINKVHTYLTGSFTSYFNQMAQSVKEHTQSIIAQMTTLKNTGVDLRKEADVFEKEDEEIEAEKEKKEAEQKAQKEQEKQKKEQKKTPGVFAKVKAWGQNAFAKIKGLFSRSHKKEEQKATSSKAPEKPSPGIMQRIKGWGQKVKDFFVSLFVKIKNLFIKTEVKLKQEIQKEESVVKDEANRIKESVKEKLPGHAEQKNKPSVKLKDASPQHTQEPQKHASIYTQEEEYAGDRLKELFGEYVA